MTTLTVCPHCECPADTASGICAGCRKPIDESSAGLEQRLIETFGDRYELLGRVGAGAFGEVYRARDQRLDRDIALKQVRLDGFRSSAEAEEMRLRSMREAKMAAKLLHPNIVTVHDVVDVAGSTLILMEYVDGTTLEARLREGERLGFEECLEPDGADRGRARPRPRAGRGPPRHQARESHDRPQGAHPHHGLRDREDRDRRGHHRDRKRARAPPITCRPEQARGAERLDGRADLFSLGCVIYECLAGYKPFQGKAVVDILLRLLHEPPASLDCEALEIPGGVPGGPAPRDGQSTRRSAIGTARELIDALRQAPASRRRPPRSERRSTLDRSREPDGGARQSQREPTSPKPVVTRRREPGTVTSFDIEAPGKPRRPRAGGRSRRRPPEAPDGNPSRARAAESSKRVYFHEGAIVFANSDVESDRLGRFLIRGGIIDESTYESAIERDESGAGNAWAERWWTPGQLSEDRVRVAGGGAGAGDHLLDVPLDRRATTASRRSSPPVEEGPPPGPVDGGDHSSMGSERWRRTRRFVARSDSLDRVPSLATERRARSAAT